MRIIISIEDLTKSVALVFLILRRFGCVPLAPKSPAIFNTYRDRADDLGVSGTHPKSLVSLS